MPKMTTEEQIDIWKKELALAMADRQWRHALQLCSWLRYALRQRELSDPEVEQARRQAKEELAQQVIGERAQQERQVRHQQLHHQIVYQIASADWDQAMDSIEYLYQDGTGSREVTGLLEELEARMAIILRAPKYQQMNRRAAALSKRFNELAEKIGGGGS